MENGVGVVAALEIVGETSGNTIVKEAIDTVSVGVVNGATISEKLAESPLFPKMVVSMVSAGEGSGDLPQMLEKVSDFYTKEVDAAISGLTSMIEPAHRRARRDSDCGSARHLPAHLPDGDRHWWLAGRQGHPR
jgi:type IV pilus assembly protein PilC